MSKVITGLCRLSYAYVFEPRASDDDGAAKYSVSLIIPKSDKDTIKKVKAAIAEAKEAGMTTKFAGKLPANFHDPLRDGDIDRADDDAYKGAYFLSANSTNKPQLVDKDLNPIIDRDELYSGCYGRASINFFPFNFNGKKGIGCGLNNLQKLKDGEPLGSVSRADVDFAEAYDVDDLM